MRKFDFYEFVGILIPGAVTLAGIFLIFPQAKTLVGNDSMSIGDLGLFTILSYAGGHLIQAIGNLLENIWWAMFGGMPTNWVITGKGNIVIENQRQRLQAQVIDRLNISGPFEINKVDKKTWKNITKQIHSCIVNHGRSAMVDILNGNYGLNRGLAAALLFTSSLSLIKWEDALIFSSILFILGLLALYRMHRFGRHYAKELFNQFLLLP